MGLGPQEETGWSLAISHWLLQAYDAIGKYGIATYIKPFPLISSEQLELC
jgi:hypothetical protein